MGLILTCSLEGSFEEGIEDSLVEDSLPEEDSQLEEDSLLEEDNLPGEGIQAAGDSLGEDIRAEQQGSQVGPAAGCQDSLGRPGSQVEGKAAAGSPVEGMKAERTGERQAALGRLLPWAVPSGVPSDMQQRLRQAGNAWVASG